MQMNAGLILSGENVGQQVATAQQVPMNAMAMQAARQDMQGAQQDRQAANAAKLARMVLSSPDPQSAYPRALQAAQFMGVDTSGLPQQFTPEVGEQLQMYASLLEMPKDERTEFERVISNLSPQEQMQAMRVKAGLEAPAQAAKPPSMPSAVQEYEYARQQGFGGSFEDWKKQQRVPGSRLEVDPATGRVTFAQGEVGGSGAKPLTEYQSKTGNLGTRMTESMARVDETEAALLKEGGPGLLETTADNFGKAGNYAKSDEYRSYQASAREWIAALLRLDSGAAVPDSEFERYFGTYFLAPGDDERTIQLKKQARETAMRAITNIMPPGMTQGGAGGAGGGFDVKTLSDDQLREMLGL